MHEVSELPAEYDAIFIHGVRSALGPHDSTLGSIEIADGRFISIGQDRAGSFANSSKGIDIDLSGFLVMPGLVNAHDHLQFALYPNLGNPPYRNYIEWVEDINATLADLIATHRSISKDVRLRWGGIRNLLCGVTTVCHHDPLWPVLESHDFPVGVVRQFGWAHSLGLGGDPQEARSATPAGRAFILHACEGIDDRARQEVFELDRLGVLDASTVLVHGLALDRAGVQLMQQRQASLIICPTSNQFLFGTTPDMELLGTVESIALGSDSPLTAAGDLLDESRFAIESSGVTPDHAYRMVTEAAASILYLERGEGTLTVLGQADLLAVRDTGEHAAERLRTLAMADIELVIIRGRVQLASETVYSLLPPQARHGLEPLWIDGSISWLRVPVKELVQKAEAVLGSGQVRLGGRPIRMPDAGTEVSTTNELPVRCGEGK